jgi:hypothetical protein
VPASQQLQVSWQSSDQWFSLVATHAWTWPASKIHRRHGGLKFSLNRKNTCFSYLKEGLSDQTTWTRANACRVASRPCRRIPTLKIVSKIHTRHRCLKFSLKRKDTCISYLKEGLSDQTTWTRANACRVASRPCRRIPTLKIV